LVNRDDEEAASSNSSNFNIRCWMFGVLTPLPRVLRRFDARFLRVAICSVVDLRTA
jgi:hypothetical protein